MNANSERFMNENISYVNLSMTVALQPEHKTYQIFDSRWEEHVLNYPKAFFPTGEYGPIEGAVTGPAGRERHIEQARPRRALLRR